MTLPSVRECTLFSANLRVSQVVATAGAALGLTISHERELPEHYPDQGLLLIATDLAPLSIPTRPGVLLLDLETDAVDSSGSLVGIAGDDREAVTNLASRMGVLLESSSSSQLITITASSGGIGLTTLVALLGLISARKNQKTLLIDESDELLRVIGARGVPVDHGLQPIRPPKVGVLAQDVIVTPALLLDARARFDSVILGLREPGSECENPTHSLLLTANTALAVEQSEAILKGAISGSMRIVLRQMSYGTLSTEQVAASLRSRQVVEWPDDCQLSLAADLGDLIRAKHAVELARQIWSHLIGGSVDRRN